MFFCLVLLVSWFCSSLLAVFEFSPGFNGDFKPMDGWASAGGLGGAGGGGGGGKRTPSPIL